MNLTPLSRIQTFRENVLLPALTEIKAMLETLEQQVFIVNNAETGNGAVDAMLQQMHFGRPYLHSTSTSVLESLTIATMPQTWIGDSLYVEVLQMQVSALEPIRIGHYCLSIEFRLPSIDHIQICSIVGYTKAEDQALQIQQHLFRENLNPQSLEQIKKADIVLSFAESYETFESQLPAPNAITAGALKAETPASNLTLSSSEVDLVPLPSLEIPVRPTPQPPHIEVPQTSQEIPPQPTEPILTPQQQLYALKLKAIDLSQQLAPSPHHPLSCKLNSDLTQPARIVALRD